MLQQQHKTTPYQALTGVRPDESKTGVFGSGCYAYVHNHTKLDARCKRAFGYDQMSPAFLIYYPSCRKVLKYRLIKFLSRNVEQSMQTDHNTPELDIPTYRPQPEADLDIPAQRMATK